MSEFVRLGSHIAIAKGKPPALMPFDGPGAAAYLTPEYLRGNAPAVQAKPAADAVLVADGDAVLLWDGSNAGEFFHGKTGLAASTMARLRADGSLDRGYFVHTLKHLQLALQSQTSGTGIPHVDRDVLEGFKVFCPGALEQARIAKILDTLDTAILQTEAIIEKLKQVKQGLLHDLLTRGIDAHGELRPPQSQAPHLYKDSPLGWMPKEWRCETVGRVIQGTPRNGLYKPAGDIGLGMLLVGQTAFTHEGSVDFGQARRVRISNAEREAFGLNQDDVLVSRVFATREGVGQPVLVPELGEPAVYESNMMRLRANLQMIQPRLLFLWLKHRAARGWIMSRAFASNQASINRETICSVPTATPPIAD
jgi:type I restriction enzyme, S subunit